MKSVLFFAFSFFICFSGFSQQCGYEFNGTDSYLVGDIGPAIRKIDDLSTVIVKFKMNSVPSGQGSSTILWRLSDANKQFSNAMAAGVLNWLDEPGEAQFFIVMYADWLVDHHLFENETEIALKMFEARAITTALIVGEWYTIKVGSNGIHPIIRINGKIQKNAYYAQKLPGQWIHNFEKTIIDGFPQGVTRITLGAQKTTDVTNPRFIFDGIISKFKIRNVPVMACINKPGSNYLGNDDDQHPNIPKTVVAYDLSIPPDNGKILDSGIYAINLDVIGNGSNTCQ